MLLVVVAVALVTPATAAAVLAAALARVVFRALAVAFGVVAMVARRAPWPPTRSASASFRLAWNAFAVGPRDKNVKNNN